MIRTDRIRRVQERMRTRGIDAYLVLTHDDYQYLLGEDRSQPRALIHASGPPVIVAFRGEVEEIRSRFGVEDVRVFSTVAQQIKDVVELLREWTGPRVSLTVGVQMGFSTPAFLLNLFQRANPQVRVVDIAPVMDDLRAVKEAEEVDCIRRAGAVAAAGMRAAARRLRPGTTENEVAAECEYAMRRAGGGGTATPVYVNSGVRSGWLHGLATEKVVESGDLVVVGLVPRFRGYCANLCRTFVVGAGGAAQRDLHATYVRAQAAGIAALRPGATPRDVDEAARAEFERAGRADAFVPGFSHSIGLSFEETPAPSIHPNDATVRLREGMTMTVGHSVLSVPGIGGVRIEDTFLVKAGGAEILTPFPLGLEPGGEP